MVTYNKVKITKIFINLVLLVLIYFFSFHFFPKISFYNKLDFEGIQTNAGKFFFYLSKPIYLSDNYYNHKYRIEKTNQFQNEFLKDYFIYLNEKRDILVNAPCPSELLANNLRNIQILNSSNFWLLNNSGNFWQHHKIDVRFSFYKFSGKLDMSKCFDYIFKKKLNKFYLLYRDFIVQDLNKKQFYFTSGPSTSLESQYPLFFQNIADSLKTIDFFIDPNANYTLVQQNDKTSTKILTFIICLLIIVSINIGYKKLDRKKVSKFINKLMNT